MDRSRHLARLAAETFDLLVVGGGISGACLAYDAARRGLRVALVEKGDFGAATSAASSKLLHGGIRFLQQARILKVRESAFERVYFQNLVPHLCRYVPFAIPAFAELSKGRLALRAALLAYAVAGAGQNRAARLAESRVPAARLVDAGELRRMLPMLADVAGITGAAILPESHMYSSERMTWALIDGAAGFGAAVANYVTVTSMQPVSGGYRVTVRDAESGGGIEVSSRTVANCAGPWMGDVNARLLGHERAPITGYSRGAHIVVKKPEIPCAVALPTRHRIEGFTDRGGRHMFMIPWRGHTLIGTSYAAHDDPLDQTVPLETDIEQLVAGINSALGRRVIDESAIVHAWAGIYPLTAARVDAAVYQGAGDYSIVDHGKSDAMPGYFSVFGAKFTTARLLAEKACDRIVAYLPEAFAPCATRHAPAPVADYEDPGTLRATLTREFGAITGAEACAELVVTHGCAARGPLAIAASEPGLAAPVRQGDTLLRAEVAWAARREMVHHLDDFVFRRSGLGTVGYPGADALENCAGVLANELGWDDGRRRREIDRAKTAFPLRHLTGGLQRP